jgi:hypothetical protein
MIECIEEGKYQSITINDVYNIIDTYSKVCDSSAPGHEKCKCKEYFSIEDLKNISNRIKNELEEYLHYEIDTPILYIETDDL